jgi:hypothetical protein
MKSFTLLICGLILFAPGCKDEVLVSCEPLTKELLALNVSGVKMILDPQLSQLLPQPTSQDGIGHLKNLQTFMNSVQACFADVRMDCYACIETFPEQSEIIFMIDSVSVLRRRVIDISTPGNQVMTIRNVHL